MTWGRNDPCPCGSGRKYKKCHLPLDEASRPASEPQKSTLHDFDNRMVMRIVEWMSGRFSNELAEAAGAWDFLLAQPAVEELLIPFLVCHVPVVRGLSSVEVYARKDGDSLPRREREWIEAQRRCWLGVWEVREVVPGKSMVLADLLSGEKRLVQEASATRSLVARDAILARVVDFGLDSLLCGTYPRSLPPEGAAQVVEDLCKELHGRPPFGVERLREYASSRALVAAWFQAVERESRPLRLQNTDGDPIRLVSDSYRFDPDSLPDMEASLATLRGAQLAEEHDEGSRVVVFQKAGNPVHAHWDNTIVGQATLTIDGTLQLQTNSMRRATALRKRVERVCGGLLSDHRRSAEDPSSLMQSARDQPGTGPYAGGKEPTPEIAEILRHEKAAHYAGWSDIPVPALNGRTPREATNSADGREQVRLLLRSFENREARQPAAIRFDVGILWRELKITDE
jgi:hypothetical protein